MKLKGETAIITGSTSGIGKKLAEILLKEGCKVSICSRNRDKVNATVTEFQKLYGDSVIGAACDVSRFGELKKLAEKTIAHFGSIRILIANAAVFPIYGPFKCLSEEQLDSVTRAAIDINLIGTINSIGAVLPWMQKQHYGRIITLSGGGADGKVPYATLYAATKGGISAFSKCLAEELKKDNKADITLNIFQPGMVKTNLDKEAIFVAGWKDEKTFRLERERLYNLVYTDIGKCCRKVIPYIIPGCKANGKVFLGFSFLKMIPKLPKIQKAMKEL